MYHSVKEKFLLACLLLFLSPILMYTQSWEAMQIPFEVNGEQLVNPLTGGLNNPQPSEVDLNFDGVNDLYVFDREGDVSMAFVSETSGGVSHYVYSHFYSNVFPALNNWVLLRDFDGDGIVDIFSYPLTPGVDGVIVFKGYNDGGHIAFERVNFYNGNFNIIYYQQNSGSYTNLYVNRIDYPAIDDIDGDGDLDVLSFSSLGGLIYFYKNNSVESGFGRDSLHFSLHDNCWGGVYENSALECPELANAAGECAAGMPFETTYLHGGSTLLSLKLDNDGDKELILGDQSFTNLVALTNGGTSQQAWFNEMDCSFPTYDIPCNLINFPAAFYLDVNHDGQKDLLAAPNNKGNVEDQNCLWLWENTGSNAAPVFEFQQENFLVEETIDHGTGSNPCFVDYNVDGLLDLLVGNLSDYIPGEKNPRLYLYENVGTITAPSFRLIDDDYLGFSAFGANFESNLAPCFGDLDGDGDEDLLVGAASGDLYYAENIAGTGNVFEFDNIVYPYMDIDGSLLSTAQIIDLDRDGLLDIILGEANGNLNFLPNQGTATNPVFHPNINETPNNPFLGNVNTTLFGATGGSSPLFLDLGEDFVLFCGTQHRGLVRYDNIDGNLNGAFDWTTNFRLGEIFDGTHTHPAIADLNADGKLDFIIGNDRGGLRAFSSNLNLLGEIMTATAVGAVNDISIYPNPAKDKVMIKCAATFCNGATLEIFNHMGIKIKTIENVKNEIVDIRNLDAGIYYFVVTKKEKNVVNKIIVGK